MGRMYGKKRRMDLSVAFDLPSLSDYEEEPARRFGLSRNGLIVLILTIVVTLLSLLAEISSLYNAPALPKDQFIYSIIMWILGAIAFMLNSLVVYLILNKSTTEIKEYKLYLLNFTVTDIIFTILLSWTLQPAPIIPGGGALIIGSMRHLGGFLGHFQFTLIAYIFSHSIISLNYCFVYRYASLCDSAARRLLQKMWYKVVLFTSGEVACFSIGMLIFDMRVSEEHFRSVTLERFPFQSHLFQNTIYFGYDYKQSPHANTFLISALTLAPLSCGFNFLCAMLIITRLQKYRKQLSHRTYNMHLKLLFALLLQTTIPLILFVLPISYVFISAILLLSNTLTNSFTRFMPIVALALHPIINACITIAFIEPYRRVVIPQFLLKKFKRVDRTITQVTTTTSGFRS